MHRQSQSVHSLFVNLYDVVKWKPADRAALAPLGACHAGEVMATWDECGVAFGTVANLAGFGLIDLVLLGLRGLRSRKALAGSSIWLLCFVLLWWISCCICGGRRLHVA